MQVLRLRQASIMPLSILLLLLLLLLATTAKVEAQQDTAAAATLIQRTTSSVDIQICVQGSLLATQRAAFQQELLKYLQTQVLNDNGVYLERQYTTITGGGMCFLYVYQGPNPDFSVYAVRQFAAMNNQMFNVPFTFPSTGISVQIPCKVDAAQWTGDDLTYLGTPIPGMWKVNDLLLWGSCLLSVLFLCMSCLCCYAMCTRVTPFGTVAEGDEGGNSILRMDKEILSLLTQKKRIEEVPSATVLKSKLKLSGGSAAASAASSQPSHHNHHHTGNTNSHHSKA